MIVREIVKALDDFVIDNLNEVINESCDNDEIPQNLTRSSS